MSFRRPRELRFPQTADVCPDHETDPRRFFGEVGRSRGGDRKTLQLCKQVERSVALTLAGLCESDALLGASVAAVVPAPDSGRLMVMVVLAPGQGVENAVEARAHLLRSTATFREQVGRSVHRKRVPQVVFDVLLAEEVNRG